MPIQAFSHRVYDDIETADVVDNPDMFKGAEQV